MLFSRRSLLVGSATLAGIGSASAAAGADNKRRIESARALALGMRGAERIPALSVAVMRGDVILWTEAFGSADVELAVPAGAAHRFRLASVSKIVTATAGAQLAARQVIDLDAPIGRTLPDLPEQHRATTLRQLFTHRGGIRHYTAKDDAPDAPGPIDRRLYKSNEGVLAVFIDDPLVAKPGERVSYSTFGYTLASIVMETAAKVPFLEIIQREIAAPLGLSSLGPDDPIRLVTNRVRGYHPAAAIKNMVPAFEGDWGNIPSNNPAYKWAGGGLLATPLDLARFGAAHLAAGKLSPSALTTLFTVYTERTDHSPPLGLGWRIDHDSAGRLRWHHAGGQDGARASLVVYPQEKLSIALATNITGTPGDVNGPSEKLANIWS
jgi:CubicO group peptidase (beta-lactamase class C family)